MADGGREPVKHLSNPLLIISDNPSLPTGLARQSRDIACLAATMPEFRVGYLGMGIGNRRKFPFTLYDYPQSTAWGSDYIQQVWEDFSDREQGVILTCDDLSRRQWFTNPAGLPKDLADFLGNRRSFKKWGYVPLDSTGPDGVSLGCAARDCAVRFDRILAASEWGCKVLKESGCDNPDWLPHGIFMDTFYPKLSAKEEVGWGSNAVAVGCVMANQSRKDFPAAFEAFARLCNHYGHGFKAWLHTDELVRYWNVYALAADYGVGDHLEVTTGLTDSQLATRYSACDCTMVPSAGEGFGFPVAESLACGTACIVTDYAAGPALVSGDCRVRPIAYRVDTAHNCLRAVLSGSDFAAAAIPQIDNKRSDQEFRSDELRRTVDFLDWGKLKYPWMRWLRDGLGGI